MPSLNAPLHPVRFIDRSPSRLGTFAAVHSSRQEQKLQALISGPDGRQFATASLVRLA
jgi:hypothetical protein